LGQSKLKTSMKYLKWKKLIIENKIILISTLFCIIFWIIESFIDTFLFHSGKHLLNNLFFPPIHEGWMRLPIFGSFIFIGLYSQKIISKRRKAEQKIVDLARFPAENPNPVLRISNNHITYINKIGKELFQIEKNNRIPNFLREMIDKSLDEEKIEEIELELKNQTYSFTITPIANADYINIYGMDITERKKAEILILEENQKLSELNQMRKDLIIRVSHELKTPLNAIYGASQRLFEYLDNNFNTSLNKYVEIINRGGKRLKKLISDIIDASKIDYNQLELKKQKENLVGIIRESIEDLLYLMNERKLFLNVDLPKELYIEIDRLRIEQVISNILSNAIKNTTSGGTINVKILDSNEYTDISIKDTGVGLTKEEKTYLFKRFGKIERYGKSLGVDIEGSGLGLFISKEIVNLHNGDILVKSEGRNKGAEFIIRLYKNHSELNK